MVIIHKWDFRRDHIKVDIVPGFGPFSGRLLTIEIDELSEEVRTELMTKGLKKSPARIEVRTIADDAQHVNHSRVVAQRIIREADLSQLDLF